MFKMRGYTFHLFLFFAAAWLTLATAPAAAHDDAAHDGTAHDAAAHSVVKDGAIVFLHYWTGPMTGGVGAMVEAHNRDHPEIPLRARGFEHESFKVGIKVMLASGATPDLFSYWAGARLKALVDKGQLAPMDDLWQEVGLDAVFSEAMAEACTYDGRKYALPVTQHAVGFFYNVDVFARIGVEPPTTWESFLAACEALREAGVTPIALGAREGWPAQFWFDFIMLRTAGPELRQKLMDGEIGYDHPVVTETFLHWKELLDAGYVNANAGQLDWAEAAQLVHSGEAAMTLMGTWIIGQFEAGLGWRSGQDFDFFPFPEISADAGGAALGAVDVIALPRDGRVEAAKHTLGHLAEHNAQAAMSAGSGALAPSLAVPESEYSPLQRKIRRHVVEAEAWAFNYDLATSPEVAALGLEAFKAFLAEPSKADAVQADLHRRTRSLFASD